MFYPVLEVLARLILERDFYIDFYFRILQTTWRCKLNLQCHAEAR